MNKVKYLFSSLTALLLIPLATASAETPTFEISIKDHVFEPKSVEIPSGTKAKLIVHNLDATPEEFESYDLNREKIVPGGGKISLFVGPLEPGEYKFFGEFNEATAQGKIIVR